MRGTIFYSGMKVLKSVLDYLRTKLEESIKVRWSDSYEYGILKGEPSVFFPAALEFTITVISTTSANVSRGVAYDINGERIAIEETTLLTYDDTKPYATTSDGYNLIQTPQSTGSLAIPMLAAVSNYFYIRYVPIINNTVFSIHKITNSKQFYEKSDGYEIVVNQTGVVPSSVDGNPFMLIGSVNASSSVDITGLKYFKEKENRIKVRTPVVALTDRTVAYALNNEYFVDEHIKSVSNLVHGSVTAGSLVSPNNPHGTTIWDAGYVDTYNVELHNRVQHTSGFVQLTTGGKCLTPVITSGTGDNYMKLSKLLVGEYVNVAGVINDDTITLGTIDITDPTYYKIVLPSVAAVYYVYLNLSGSTISLAFSTDASYNGYPKPTGTVTWPTSYNKLSICKVEVLSTGPIVLGNLVDLRPFGTISSKDLSHYEITSYKEIPSGSITGTTGFDGNQDFILAKIPVTNSEHVFVNGILQEPGVYCAPSTALTAGSSTTKMVASGTPGWATNQWVGYTVAVYNVATTTWNLRKIISNDANSVTIAGTDVFDFTPTTGDFYEIGNDYSFNTTISGDPTGATIHFVAGSIPPVDSTLRVTYDILRSK